MGLESASTVVCAISARSAVVHQSASTVVYALRARSAVGHKFASTVVYAPRARSAVGDQSASTVVSALGARSAVGHKSASMVVCAISARSAVGDQYASTVVGALSARSARSSERSNFSWQPRLCVSLAPSHVSRTVRRPPHSSDEQGRRVMNNQYSISVVLDPVAPTAEAAGVLIHLHRARPRAPVPLDLRPHGLPTRRLRLIQRRPVVV